MSRCRHALGRSGIILATGFGLGLSPVASGTVGTVLALPIVWFFWEWLAVAWKWQLMVAAGLSLLSVPVCAVAERHYGTKDDGRIVADEYMTFPLCMVGLPWNGWMVLTAFLTCRFFDIVKPEPANRMQGLHGGTGIVMDDVVAALYSLAINHILYRGWVWLMPLVSDWLA